MRPLFLILTAAGLAGCSLFGADTTRASGVVVNAETGAPVSGIDVSFRTGGGFAVYPAVDTDRTDGAGRFDLASDEIDGGSAGLTLSVNDCAYEQPNCRYVASYGSFFPAGFVEHGESDANIRLELIPIRP